jgi:hypothetical protein
MRCLFFFIFVGSVCCAQSIVQLRDYPDDYFVEMAGMSGMMGAGKEWNLYFKNNNRLSFYAGVGAVLLKQTQAYTIPHGLLYHHPFRLPRKNPCRPDPLNASNWGWHVGVSGSHFGGAGIGDIRRYVPALTGGLHKLNVYNAQPILTRFNVSAIFLESGAYPWLGVTWVVFRRKIRYPAEEKL